jgi:HAD superfamily hydrolase (TIGR01509 family)
VKLGAVIFDFNGVVADDEPQHARAFARVLEPLGVELTEAAYFSSYLGLDDRDLFRQVLGDHDQPIPGRDRLAELVAAKADAYRREIESGVALCAGARELIIACARELPIAIGSGARRHEIVHILEAVGLGDRFDAIVSADDVSAGKPDPETYALALTRLRRRRPALEAGTCVVLEDAPHGIAAAHAAGMRCVGVCGSNSRAELAKADLVVDSLEELTVEALSALPG